MARTLAAFALLCGLPTAALAQQSFPYEGVVIGDDVYVRSGPGRNYYPTSRLSRGDRVTVVRHDPGGWFAIQPPPGSFSWISGAYVRRTNERFGTVTGNNVMVRIGSFESDVRDVYQQRLNEADEVVILEARTFGEGPAAEIWYRIEPPRGELRWVAGEYVRPASELVAGGTGTGAPAATGSPYLETSRSEPVLLDPPPRGGSQSARAVSPASPETAGPAVATTSPAELDRVRLLVEQADRALEQTLANDIATWELGPIRAVYQQALEAARGQAGPGTGSSSATYWTREIDGRLARLEQYALMKQSYDRVQSIIAQVQAQDAQLAAAQAELRQAASIEPLAPPRFDGIGILQRSTRAGGPRYVLVDLFGHVDCYVTPWNGVDLEPFLSQTIAVVGQSSYQPQLGARHVVVRQVYPVQVVVQ